jgi:hypothetical protein
MDNYQDSRLTQIKLGLSGGSWSKSDPLDHEASDDFWKPRESTGLSKTIPAKENI